MSLTLAERRGAPEPPAGGQVAALLDRLDDVLGELAGVDLGGLTPEQTGQAAVRMTAARRAAEAVDARIVRRFAHSGLWSIEGFTSPAAWLGARTNEATGTIYLRLRGGQRNERHRVLADAMARGDISARHLEVVADAHRHYPTLAAALDGIETELAGYAAQATPEDLRRRLAATLHRIDPDAVDAADARRRHDDAGLHISTLLDGWGKVDALLPPEIHAKLLAVLDAAHQAIRRHPAPTPDPAGAQPGAQPGDQPGDPTGDPTGADTGLDPRPRRRRRLHAFEAVLDAAIEASGQNRLPDTGGTRPLVTIICPVDTLATSPDQQSRAAVDAMTAKADAYGAWIDSLTAEPAAPAPAPPDWPGTAPASLPRTGGLLGARTLQRLLCDPSIRRMLVDPAGLVLDVGRTTRTISPQLRAAVEARDRWRCRYPGCRHPIDHIHHVIPWSQGGTTDRANLAGLCYHHHDIVHTRGWHLTGNADHELLLRQPGYDGQEWTSPAPGAPVVG